MITHRDSMNYNGSFTFQGEDPAEPDLIYYNAHIINNGHQSDPNRPDQPDPVLTFSETRNVPIITDASKYNFSIVRFNMNGPGRDLPLFIPQIRTGAFNISKSVNETVYDAGLTLLLDVSGNTYNFSSSKPVIYQTETLDTDQAPVPLASTVFTGQDISTRYYWVYTIAHWVNLVNAAYQSAWDDIQAQVTATPGLGSVTLATEAPRFTWNPTSNLMSIYADRNGFGDNGSAGTNHTSNGTAQDENWSMWADANLYGMFANFDNQYYNNPNNLTVKYLITNIAGLYQNIVSVASPPAATQKSYWVMTQDSPSTSSLWSPIEAIVFTTGTIPLVSEQEGVPIRFGTGNAGAPIGTQSAFIPQITDISLLQQSPYDYKGFVQYAPSAEYRMASFQKGKASINQIDLQVYWKNRLDGKLYPVQMYNLSSVSLKIMFRRRGVYDYPHPARTDIAKY